MKFGREYYDALLAEYTRKRDETLPDALNQLETLREKIPARRSASR